MPSTSPTHCMLVAAIHGWHYYFCLIFLLLQVIFIRQARDHWISFLLWISSESLSWTDTCWNALFCDSISTIPHFCYLICVYLSWLCLHIHVRFHRNAKPRWLCACMRAYSHNIHREEDPAISKLLWWSKIEPRPIQYCIHSTEENVWLDRVSFSHSLSW